MRLSSDLTSTCCWLLLLVGMGLINMLLLREQVRERDYGLFHITTLSCCRDGVPGGRLTFPSFLPSFLPSPATASEISPTCRFDKVEIRESSFFSTSPRYCR